MDPEQLIRDNEPREALAALTERVRERPGDSRLRVFLAQLLCVLGQWERALNQMTVAAELDALAVPMKQVYGEAVRCEALRAEVFGGTRTPMVLGEPPQWLASLIEAQQRLARDPADDSIDALHAQAFDQAPAIAGQVDGSDFQWIADADMRVGPVLEAFVNGRYYWVPFEHLSRVQIEPPEDLRDFIWLPANLHLSNGGETLALLPARYPGTEAADDGRLLLARRTEWNEPRPEFWVGQGQRLLATDQGDHALMDIREIVLHGEVEGDGGQVPA